MKKLLAVLVLSASFLVFVQVQSFAIADVSAYGGIMFKGDVENDSDADPKDWHYGLKGHYNTSLIPLIELGVGAYYQYSKITFDVTGGDEDYTRQSLGFDVNLILGLPVVHPYARLTYSIWDKFDDDKVNFKGYGAGAGLEITFFPFLRAFGEYMYDYSDHGTDLELKSHSVNIGVKFDL